MNLKYKYKTIKTNFFNLGYQSRIFSNFQLEILFRELLGISLTNEIAEDNQKLIDDDYNIPLEDLDIYDEFNSLNKNLFIILNNIERVALFQYLFKNMDTSLRLKSVEKFQNLFNCDRFFSKIICRSRNFLYPIRLIVCTKIYIF